MQRSPPISSRFTIVESPSAAVRLRAARAFIERFAPGDEVLLVGASRGSVDDLARSIAVDRGAAVGLHRFSVTQLAARLAATALAERGLAPGTMLGHEAVAARAAFEAGRAHRLDYFAPVATMPGFSRALARTLEELRLAGVGPAALASLPLGGGDLAELLERFGTQFEAASATDRAALFETAIDALRNGAVRGHPLLLLDVPVDSRMEREFVAALLAASRDALVTVPFGDLVALEAFNELGGTLEVHGDHGGHGEDHHGDHGEHGEDHHGEHGGHGERTKEVPVVPVPPVVISPVVPVPPAVNSDLAALRRYLFARTQPPQREPAGDVTFFSAPGEAREAVEIARRVLEEARRGVRFDEMAIFIRSPQHYVGLIEQAFERAGIPACFDRGTRRPHPSGRAFLALLACAVQKLSAKRFAEYLSLGQVPQLQGSGVRGQGTGLSQGSGDRHEASGLAIAADDEALAAIARLDKASDENESEEEQRLRPGRGGGADRGPSEPPEGAPRMRRRRAPNNAAAPSESERASAGSARPELVEGRGWGPASAKECKPPLDDDDVAVVDGTLRAPWKWEALIVESCVIGNDSSRWHRRLDGLANEYRRKIRELRKEEPESPKLRRLERDLRNLAHLRAFALPIIDRLASWPPSATWGEWIDVFQALAPLVLRRPDDVARVLGALRPMAAIGPVSLGEARDVLAERLLTLEREPPARRYGRVFVAGPRQARGRSFRVVFVPGLAERIFPQKPREDPMLVDELRGNINHRVGPGFRESVGPSFSLAIQEDRARAERLLLRLAVGSASERLYLSYPSVEVAEARPRVPSFYALDVMRAITGRIPDHDDLARAAAEQGGARLAWPAPADPARALDDVEHDLAVLRQLLDNRDRPSVKGRAHYLLRLNDCLKRSITVRWARARSAWTQYDGLVRITGQTKAALAAERLAARPYSLSALQKFSNCPYQFLLSAIYRLEPAEEPEPIQRLDPLTRGSIFHRVQTEFFRELEKTGRMKNLGHPEHHKHHEHLLSVLESVLARVAEDEYEQLAPAIDRVWQDEIADMAKDLRVWVRRLSDGGDWQPFRFELSFGLKDDPGDVRRDPRSLPDPINVDGRFLLRGSIDLLERRTDGELRVTDHKTGKCRVTDRTVIDGGRLLQPVLYGLAVETGLDTRVVSGRLYYCTSAGGFTEHEIPLSDRNRRAGLEALEIVDRAIELGFLPPAPAERACAWCDFRPVCGPHEERRVKRKSPDPLGDLEALRGMP